MICAAESFARETFTGDLSCGGGTSQVVNLQQEFRALVRLETSQYEALKANLSHWRKLVNCGEIEFDPAQEDDFREAIRALIELESCLIEKFDAYRDKGLLLEKTRFIGFMLSHQQTAQNILDSWQSPEWETVNERVVKLDREQTAYLRKKLSSCE